MLFDVPVTPLFETIDDLARSGLVLPGSRRSEVKGLFPTILATARLLQQRRPELQFLLPLASSLTLGTLPLTDPFVLAQTLAARHVPELSALVGAGLVVAFYALAGGRVFCAWVCPVGVVTDTAAWLRRRLGINTGRAPRGHLRHWLQDLGPRVSGDAALAVLAKGLIGIVFPAGIIFFYLLVTREWQVIGRMRLIGGLSLFAAVTVPWFVAVSLRNPEFPQFFFIHEHFQRFTSTVHGRYQPVWFFVPVLLGTMLPWSFYIPGSLWRGWRDRPRPAPA